MIDYSNVKVSPHVLFVEEWWARDLPDLRDPELIEKLDDLRKAPNYDIYIESVRDAVKRACGKRFIMYGAVSDINFALWREGEALRPMGMTFKKDVAKAAKKGVPLEGKKFVIFQTYVELPWVVMRGNVENEELVVDATQVSYHTLSVIG